jgi:hypothetical protein
VADLQEQGVQFRSLTDGIDTTTPAGRFFFHVMASLAQMERELLAERTRAGLAAARRPGRRPQAANDSGQGGIGPEAVEERDGPRVATTGPRTGPSGRARPGRCTRRAAPSPRRSGRRPRSTFFRISIRFGNRHRPGFAARHGGLRGARGWQSYRGRPIMATGKANDPLPVSGVSVRCRLRPGDLRSLGPSP